MVKNLLCGAVAACLLALNVASAQDCGCSAPAPAPSCGCSSCQHTCCDACCDPLGTALRNIGCGLKTGLCHLKGGVQRLLCPIRYNGCCNSCSQGCGGSCGGNVSCGCGAGVPEVMHYGSPMIESAPGWNGKTAPTPPTPSVMDEPTAVVPEPARFQPPGSWKSAQAGQPTPTGNLYYSKVIAEKSGVSRVSHTTKATNYYATPRSK